jgi:SAM-dependent methyltransferase
VNPTPTLDAAVESGWACPTSFDADRLRDEVVAMYERVATRPAPGEFHFHVGAGYAVSMLGYDAQALQSLPARCTERFAGVGNPLLAGPVPAGAVVLDHACGAGMDLLLALRAAGEGGCAIGVDLTPAMRDAARAAAAEAGVAARVEIAAGSFDALPLPDASVDLVLSNGVLNLAPDKLRVVQEVRRVLRPGGALYLSDVVLERELSELARANPALWAACVGGALTEPALLALLARAGFDGVRIAARHDCFRGTSLPLKFGREIAVGSVTLAARKRL